MGTPSGLRPGTSAGSSGEGLVVVGELHGDVLAAAAAMLMPSHMAVSSFLGVFKNSKMPG